MAPFEKEYDLLFDRLHRGCRQETSGNDMPGSGKSNQEFDNCILDSMQKQSITMLKCLESSEGKEDGSKDSHRFVACDAVTL
jgi:hypothetical protein